MKAKTAVCRDFSPPLQIANVDYFQIKIQLSGFSAYPDSSPYKLIRVSGALLYQHLRRFRNYIRLGGQPIRRDFQARELVSL